MCGIQLPAGLRESDKLPEPIFTPATKAQTGHDENVSFEHVVSLIGEDLAAAAARSHAGDLFARRAVRGDEGHHHRRHEVRIRLRGRRTGAGRRSADAGFVALLAGGHVQAGRPAVLLRQAVRARLPGIDPLEQAAAGAAAARRKSPRRPARSTGRPISVLTGREL